MAPRKVARNDTFAVSGIPGPSVYEAATSPRLSASPLIGYFGHRLLAAMQIVIRLGVENRMLTPRDLLTLCHCSRYLRKLGEEDRLYERWFGVLLGGHLREALEQAQVSERLSKRQFVLLAMGKLCMDCKSSFAGHVYVPAMRRVCLRCLVASDTYVTTTQSKAGRKYQLKDKEIADSDLIIFHITNKRMPSKVISEHMARNMAEAKHQKTGVDLDRMLATREARLRASHATRMADYAEAVARHDELVSAGREQEAADLMSRIGADPPKLRIARENDNEDRTNRLAASLAVGWLRIRSNGEVVHDPIHTCMVCRRMHELKAEVETLKGGLKTRRLSSSSSASSSNLTLTTSSTNTPWYEESMPASNYHVHLQDMHLKPLGAACQPWCSSLFTPEKGGDCMTCINRTVVKELKIVASDEGAFAHHIPNV